MTAAFPANADWVVVQHHWWDDNTRRGVPQNVTWTPLDYDEDGTPNLVDAAAKGWVKTRQWSSRPDAASGYMAVPLTASNDPDLTGFPGYRVAPGGEDEFTIAVDVAAPLVAADQRMVNALAALTPTFPITLGQMVRAVWLTDVALVDPSPTPPAAFYTAGQPRDLVVDAISVHDSDPDAHADIRALISTSNGATRLAATATTSGAVSGHRVVTPGGDGRVDYASNTTPGHLTAPLWLTDAAASAGAPVTVVTAGPVTEPSWTWTPGAPIYLGAAGALTQTPPAAPAFLVVLGAAITPTSIYLDRQPTIALTA